MLHGAHHHHHHRCYVIIRGIITHSLQEELLSRLSQLRLIGSGGVNDGWSWYLPTVRLFPYDLIISRPHSGLQRLLGGSELSHEILS